MILSVSNIAWAPEERLEAYDLLAGSGVRGLEIAPGLFFGAAEDPFAPDAATARAALDEIAARGLSLVSMQSLLFGVQGAALFGDADSRAAFVRAMERAIDLAGRVGIPNLVFGSPGQRRIPESMAVPDAWAQAAETFRRLGDRAAAAGTAIAMESNPVAYGTNFLTTLEEAEAFVTQVDHPAVTLILDLGAMHLNGGFGTLPARAGTLAPRLSHVHVSEPHLVPAPDDATDLTPILSALRRAGYDRAVSIEMKRPEGGLDVLRGRLVALTRAAAATRREDVLVSVCISELPPDANAFESVAALARQLDARFRFREIVVVAEESCKDTLLALVRQVDNLRLFTVRDGTPFYRRRVIAADEAIGDVVMIANVEELPHLDWVAMIERAADHQQMVLAARAAGMVERALSSPLVALGRVAGFKVNPRDLQTMTVPRTLLNQLLAHPNPELALRFPPRDVRMPLAFGGAAPDMSALRQTGTQRQRLDLLQKLLIHVAPRLLMAVTLSSALLAAIGFFYALYVLGAWIVVDDLAPGWLTLSAMLSLTAFFLGVSIMGLSLGLQQLLARAGGDGLDGVASEINRIDLFGQVVSDLNVELEREDAAPPERGTR